ncbi:MAG: hypothetical protein ACMVY4_17695 [Minwuia sp.]|uniref:hypothetical protein n=1 Tax=Minwuia sp. TaxID=2493630 RepID=UPI003A8B7978
MISDRAAGKMIAIVTIMVCAAVASTLDTVPADKTFKIAGSVTGTSAEAFQPVRLTGAR